MQTLTGAAAHRQAARLGVGAHVEGATRFHQAHVQAMAEAAGAEYRYLGRTHTKAKGSSKEDLARGIAEQRGIQQGLVGVV